MTVCKYTKFLTKTLQGFVFLLILTANISAYGRTRVEVVDSVTGQPVPHVALFLTDTKTGALTDDHGRADIFAPGNKATLRLSVLGYTTKTITFDPRVAQLRVPIVESGIQLKEVTYKKKRNKYSKKNNPAVDFANRLRTLGPQSDPRRHDFYNYDRYERFSLGFNRFSAETDTSKGFMKDKFAFLREHVDTSAVTGQQVLILSVKEKASEVHFRKSPRTEKTYVTGVRTRGLDDFIDQESIQVLLEDFMREVDLYQNDIGFLHSNFVSPLSRIAPDFYKFFLTDTVDVGGERCIELSFTPHNTSMFGFTGHVYVPMNDSTMSVRRVDMHLPPHINLNFVEKLYLTQEYATAPDGTRLKTADDMTIEFLVAPGTQGLYARRSTRYDHHDFNPPSKSDIFNIGGREIVAENAAGQPDNFYVESGFSKATRNEQRIDTLVNQMRSVPVYAWSEKLLDIIITGYVPTHRKDSKFDIGPITSIYSSDELEGKRIRLGGMTTANLNPQLFAKGYVAYGFKDKKVKYHGELEYSFNRKKYHTNEFPIHSVKGEYTYDVDHLGQRYLHTSPDNIFLLAKREKDLLLTYHRNAALTYTYETRSNLQLTARVASEQQIGSWLIPFTNGLGESLGHFTETSLEMRIRWAPGEKFIQNQAGRHVINHTAPVFLLSHKFAPAKAFGNRYPINVTEASVQRRFWFSAFGYADCILSGGHVWSRSPYTSLLPPNANLSYTIQEESFSCLNPLEFINDSYVSWNLIYWANGAILNQIPLVKKLKLREVFCFKGVSGNLSDRNNPLYNPNLLIFPEAAKTRDMNWKPYMEFSAGLDNIFKIIRLEYVWRLSWRDTPGCDHGGLRFNFHLRF